MWKNTKVLAEILKKMSRTRDNDRLLIAIVYALDDVLSLNDFNTLIKRLKEEIDE